MIAGGATNVSREGETTSLPNRFVLHQNYPNPFNPTTTIRYAVPEASHVQVHVFDLLGRPVATLVDNSLQPGMHTTTWDARGAASGVYFVVMTATAAGTPFRAVRKMLLLR